MLIYPAETTTRQVPSALLPFGKSATATPAAVTIVGFCLLISLTLELNPLTCQTGITENDYRAIIDGLEEDVDLMATEDDDEELGPLSVFQVIQATRERELQLAHVTLCSRTWLTITPTFQINSDDEEYEIEEDEEEEEGDGGEEGRPSAAEGLRDDSYSEEEEDSDGDVFVLGGMKPHGLDDK